MVEEEVVMKMESLISDFLDLATEVDTEFNKSALGEINLDCFLAQFKYEQNVYGIAKITNIVTIDECFEFQLN